MFILPSQKSFFHDLNFCALLSVRDINYRFIYSLETIQALLLILCSLSRNSGSVTAKQMDGAASIFDLPLYKNYFPHRHLSTFVQGLVSYCHKSDDGKYAFSVNIKLNQHAAFCDEHRFCITITNFCVSLKHIIRLATSIR